jgi:hypothetical protein
MRRPNRQKDIEEVYEADGANKLTPHRAAVNRPRIVNDTPRSAPMRVPIIELLRTETIAAIFKLVH